MDLSIAFAAATSVADVVSCFLAGVVDTGRLAMDYYYCCCLLFGHCQKTLVLYWLVGDGHGAQ
jgi:hypothetical protein